jgi:hypothetical protein
MEKKNIMTCIVKKNLFHVCMYEQPGVSTIVCEHSVYSSVNAWRTRNENKSMCALCEHVCMNAKLAVPAMFSCMHVCQPRNANKCVCLLCVHACMYAIHTMHAQVNHGGKGCRQAVCLVVTMYSSEICSAWFHGSIKFVWQRSQSLWIRSQDGHHYHHH